MKTRRPALRSSAASAVRFQAMLDELETRHQQEMDGLRQSIPAFQTEAYQMGHQAGWTKGQAFGELHGQNMLAESLNRVVDERHSLNPDTTHADIERAKKGILH